ncbi:MAG: DUF4838 domain-containing protein, partial [Lentisphaerae bacterium]|nr:DUF4838 domain-containing protein [Lentisphaerota bacterium]
MSIPGLRSGIRESQPYIVKEGAPAAQIVIAGQPQRTTLLAARELQRGIQKITGAELPIVRQPSDEVPVSIFVGESPYTRKLGITAEGLDHGAYRVVSGKEWLVLIGDDSNWDPSYEPSENEYKNNCTGNRVTGPDELADADFDKPVDVWRFDERGSFNAVCGFLRSLGVRWYMPGDVGEVAPEMASILLPEVDEIVRPTLPELRSMHYAKWKGNRDIFMWLMRLGDRRPAGFGIAHGMVNITRDKELEQAHPEYYAQYGNKPRQGPQACFSSPGLFEETVKHARKLFDEQGYQSVSIMPADGYTSMCSCDLCKGQDTPERGSRGRTSDHVWDFVNRVAGEIAKTHPDKTVNCLAYGSYWLPPEKIAKLHPNVLVGIVHGRRPREDKPEEQERIRENREAWMEKTDNQIFVFENYPMGGWYLPWFVPHVIADTINQTKGESLGEDIWTTLVGRNGEPGFYHFPVYFTMRMYWGDKNQDVDPMLAEYYRLFYGPAEKEMRAFFEYCEQNWREAGKEREKADRVLELIEEAKTKVDPDSDYGQRIALVDRFLGRLRKRLDNIGVETKRVGVPELRLVKAEGKVAIDGKLDDEMWKNIPESSGGEFKELQTGEKPKFGTTFKAAWGGDGIYFAIRCEEDPDDKIVIGTTTQDDPAVYEGDNVELLLETPEHSYYQMTVNPAGAIVDLDRSEGLNWNWDAQAEIATSQGEGYWIVEMFLPVFESAIDPNH